MLKQRIAARRDVKIAVIGIGYVGLPLAVEFARLGFDVFGVDINPALIDILQGGKSTLEMLSDQQIADVVQGTRKLKLRLVDREPSRTSLDTLQSLAGVDVFIICVPTPLHPEEGWNPDTKWIKKSADLIKSIHDNARIVQEELLIILESTSYPGTTREIFSGLATDFKRDGTEVYLAFSPERTSPGPRASAGQEPERGSNPFEIPRIVGARNQASEDVAVSLYETVFDSVRRVESLEAAEMTKLFENTFRFVSIGFANEMAKIARSFGINIWKMIDAASTKPFGLGLCFPGLIGGHCIPIDPHYLAWAMRNQKQSANFVEIAERAHQDLRREAVDLILRLLGHHKKCPSGSSILFFGVSYKKNIGDVRESAVLELMKKFYAYGAKISFWDPVRADVKPQKPLRLEFTRDEFHRVSPFLADGLQADSEGNGIAHIEPDELTGTWTELKGRCIGGEFDCVVLGTDHDVFQTAYCDLAAKSGPPIADLCDAFRSRMSHELSNQDLNKARERLARERKYMLLGFD